MSLTPIPQSPAPAQENRPATPEEIAEKKARLQMDKANCIRDCLTIGTGWGEEAWKQKHYWDDNQKDALVGKLHEILMAL